MDEVVSHASREMPTILRISAGGQTSSTRFQDMPTAPPEAAAPVSHLLGCLSLIRDSRVTSVHSETTDDK